MPPTKDLYEILGVSRTATQDEIRKAYLKLAHKYHPDKTGGDAEAEQRLKEVNAAYDVLKNAEKRKQYDRFGSEGSPFGAGGFGGGQGAGFEAPFEDFFDMLFGQGGRRGGGGSRAQQGRDLEMGVTVSLLEAARGVKKTIRFNRKETCSSCRGSGVAPGSQPEACTQCGGAGQVRATHGFFAVNRVCPRCGGSGRFIPKPCRTCGGSGFETAKRELEVEIPPGIESGHQLRVSGEGEPGANGGPRGSLYLAITVEPHEVFKRDGTTITCDVPVSFTQAALGDKIRVPTLDGEAEVSVPAGTQSGTQFRLRGLGMPDLRGYRQGDQIVQVNVETPTKLSKRQKELLEEFQSLSDHKNYPLYRRFLDKFKL